MDILTAEVRLSTLKSVVLSINNERIRLSNLQPGDMDHDTHVIAEASNNAKLIVLRQLFGYDFIQSILDNPVQD